jgi:hypothetical protein
MKLGDFQKGLNRTKYGDATHILLDLWLYGAKNRKDVFFLRQDRTLRTKKAGRPRKLAEIP